MYCGPTASSARSCSPCSRAKVLISPGVVRVGIVDSGEALPGEADHFVGDVDAMDLVEVAAEGTHEAAGAAADLERGAARGQALEFGGQVLDDIGGSGEELLVALLAAAE